MAHYPADTFQEATEIAIEASNQLHGVINGDANAEVTVEDGSKIPSVRKAMVDSLYFKPPIAWAQGEYEDTYNQLREFVDGNIKIWCFAKGATVSTPVLMSTSPLTDENWTVWTVSSASAAILSIKTITEDSYILEETDIGKCIEMDSSTSNTVTIPLNSSVLFPIDTLIIVRQMGTGVTSVVAEGGVTIRNPQTSNQIYAQYGSVSLHKRGENEWCIDGDL